MRLLNFAVRIAFACFLSVVVLAGGAQAQTKLKTPQQVFEDVKEGVTAATSQPAATPQTERAKLGCDPLNFKPGCKAAQAKDSLTTFESNLTAPMQSFITFAQGDFAGAETLAGNFTDMPDGNGKACLKIIQHVGDVVTQLKNGADNETLGVATVWEALRLLHMTMQQTCQSSACSQVFTEAGNVVKAAASAVAPIKPMVQIPNLTDICSGVPPIASVALTPDTTPPSAPAK